jgi:hypothetical protein
VTIWGDGSGTGTGGTDDSFHDDETDPVDMWVDIWSAFVSMFSSNWKEAQTLVLALRQDLLLVTNRCAKTSLWSMLPTKK